MESEALMSQQITIQKGGQRNKSFLDASLRLEGIIELLRVCQECPKYYSLLFRKSRFKLKKSYIKYLNYCREGGLLERKYIPMRSRPNGYDTRYVTKKECFSVYYITDKGRLFLDLVK